MTHISAGQVMLDLYDIVSEFGEGYKYPQEVLDTHGSCVYVVDGKPSCIVGQVLAKHNLLDTQVAEINSNASQLRYEGFTAEAARVLAVAQSVQDQGGTWGMAVTAARFARDDV